MKTWTREGDMTRPYSLAFRQKLVEQLTGKNALNASQLSRQTGIRQQNLSRWLDEARSLPLVASDTRIKRNWTAEQKAQVITEASKLTGEQLTAYLDRQGIQFALFERWRRALAEDGQDPKATSQRIRALERELARKEKALAEAATLLVLKKTIASHFQDEDDDIDGASGK
jgi:transposase-like protein